MTSINNDVIVNKELDISVSIEERLNKRMLSPSTLSSILSQIFLNKLRQFSKRKKCIKTCGELTSKNSIKIESRAEDFNAIEDDELLMLQLL